VKRYQKLKRTLNRIVHVDVMVICKLVGKKLHHTLSDLLFIFTCIFSSIKESYKNSSSTAYKPSWQWLYSTKCVLFI